MAEQRQPFRFRLPWLAAPAPPPTNQPESRAEPTPARAPAQRPPFRPAGVAPSSAQPPSQTRATSQPPSQPQTSRAPPVSSTRPVPQMQVTTQPHPSAPQSRSPSRVTTPPGKSKISAPQKSQPEVKPTSEKAPATTVEISQPQKETMKQETSKPPLKEPQTTVEISQPQKEKMKQETSKPPLEEPQPLAVLRTPSPEKVSLEDVKPIVSGPRRQPYQTSSEEDTKTQRGKNHEEIKEKKVTDAKIPRPKAEPKGNPLEVLDERDQSPDEELFDGKEVPNTFRDRHHTEGDIHGQEMVIRSPPCKSEIAGEKAPMHKEMKEGAVIHKLGAGRDRHSLHEKPYCVITLSGENTGATMYLSSDSECSKRERTIHIHRGYKLNPDESRVDTTTDGEQSSGGKKQPGGSKLQDLAKEVYVNNNAQGVNNSLVFNSSVNERNPGVHVAVSRKLVEPELGQPAKESTTVETRKSQVAITPTERFAYAPTIRRRCLRGLFLESSESDPENPEKPRRHGCRVSCNQ